MITKKDLDLIQKVFGTKRLEGSMPYAFVDSYGVSIKSIDNVHSIVLRVENTGSQSSRISYTMFVSVLSHLSAFDDVTVYGNGTIELYDAASQQIFEANVAMENGEYVNILSRIQNKVSSSKNNSEDDTMEFFVEDKYSMDSIYLFIQDKCYMSPEDFAHIKKMMHLLVDTTVYITRIPEENSFVLYNEHVTYMSDNSTTVANSEEA